MLANTEKLLLDTDIGGDIDDAVALAYLLSQPRCDLLGVTTVSGESARRAAIASALCHAAGKGDIPVYAGPEDPLIVPQRQHIAHQAAHIGDLPHQTDFPTGEAIEFLRHTIRANPGEVTLLAIGPMTNVALLFASDPEIPSLLKRLVMMIGRYGAPRHRALDGDWNALCDPHAAAIAFRAPVTDHRSVPLDVTLQLSMPADEVKARFDHGLLAVIRQLDATELTRSLPIIFHDPLAAATIFDDGLCAFERGHVEVDLASEATSGMTHWQIEATGPHQVAFSVDRDRFFDHYFATLG